MKRMLTLMIVMNIITLFYSNELKNVAGAYVYKENNVIKMVNPIFDVVNNQLGINNGLRDILKDYPDILNQIDKSRKYSSIGSAFISVFTVSFTTGLIFVPLYPVWHMITYNTLKNFTFTSGYPYNVWPIMTFTQGMFLGITAIISLIIALYFTISSPKQLQDAFDQYNYRQNKVSMIIDCNSKNYVYGFKVLINGN